MNLENLIYSYNINMIGSIIGLILTYFAYIYLRNLSNCSCVNQIFVERLKNIEALILTLSIFSLITSIIINIFMNDVISKIISYTKYFMYGFGILALIMFIIYCYFVYDTYMFSSTMNIPCKCSDGWQKYYIYFQAITMVLIILGGIATSIRLIMNPSILYTTISSYPSSSSSSSSSSYGGNKYKRNKKNKRSKR